MFNPSGRIYTKTWNISLIQKVPHTSSQFSTPRINCLSDSYHHRLVFPTLEFLVNRPHSTHIFVTSFIHSAWFWDSPMILCVLETPSFILLGIVMTVPQCVYPFILCWWTPGLSSSFRILWIKLLWTFLWKIFVKMYFHFSQGNI